MLFLRWRIAWKLTHAWWRCRRWGLHGISSRQLSATDRTKRSSSFCRRLWKSTPNTRSSPSCTNWRAATPNSRVSSPNRCAGNTYHWCKSLQVLYFLHLLFQLFDNSMIAAGLIDDPRRMLTRINELLAKTLEKLWANERHNQHRGKANQEFVLEKFRILLIMSTLSTLYSIDQSVSCFNATITTTMLYFSFHTIQWWTQNTTVSLRTQFVIWL